MVLIVAVKLMMSCKWQVIPWWEEESYCLAAGSVSTTDFCAWKIFIVLFTIWSKKPEPQIKILAVTAKIEVLLTCSHHHISSSMGKTNECHEVTFLAGEECLYSVVKRSAVSLGWKVIGEEASDKVKRDCHVIWVDKSFANDKRFISIQPWQRINHFPGMTNICRKIRLAQSLELMSSWEKGREALWYMCQNCGCGSESKR